MLTGEPIPVEKNVGDEVATGTINVSGSFLFQSKRIGADTVLAQIINMVRQAQSTKPAIGRLVDKVASVFVPAVLIISVITFLIWFNFAAVDAVSLCPGNNDDSFNYRLPMRIRFGNAYFNNGRCW